MSTIRLRQFRACGITACIFTNTAASCVFSPTQNTYFSPILYPRQDASRDGFLLFHAEKSKAARARLLPQASSSSPPSVDSPPSLDAEAQRAATAKVAGAKLVS